MSLTQPAYQSFLLRVRQVDNGGRPVWRVSLQAVGESTLHHFTSLAALNAFLQANCMGRIDDSFTLNCGEVASQQERRFAKNNPDTPNRERERKRTAKNAEGAKK